MAVTLENLVTYLEDTLGLDSDLDDNVRFTFEPNPIPAFKNYGVHIYSGQNPAKIQTPHKLGPWLKETWTLNVDLIINRAFTPRVSISDSKGVSYWEHRMTQLLLHGTNSGTFRDSYWQMLFIDSTDGAQIIRGLFTCETENKYP